MAVERSERLVNLVLCLLSTRQYLGAERIRATVPGYHAAASDEAFFRMFERDKTALREQGIPLETGRNSMFDVVEGYRIARRNYELGDLDLEPDEAAALALATQLWRTSPELAGAAQSALVKLRAAGVEIDPEAGLPGQGLAAHDPDASGSARSASVMSTLPVVHPPEASLPEVVTAAQARRPIRFHYQRTDQQEPALRQVEPWGAVALRGRWYLVGYDRDRQAPRCFRLSRMVDQPEQFGSAGEVTRPEEVDLLAFVREQNPPRAVTTARIRVTPGAANGLRRAARHVGADEHGDLLELDVLYPEQVAGWLAGFGPDVLVLQPASLRRGVRQVLLDATRPQETSAAGPQGSAAGTQTRGATA